MGLDPQSWNEYVYSINNPVNFVDYTGLATCKISVGAFGGGGLSKGIGGAGEYGRITLEYPDGSKYSYSYLCFGPMVGVGYKFKFNWGSKAFEIIKMINRFLKAGSGSYLVGETGTIECPDKPKDLQGLGTQVSAAAGVGLGYAGSQYGQNLNPYDDLLGSSSGPAFTLGVTASLMWCYTWYHGPVE